jgi:hypothetical protein
MNTIKENQKKLAKELRTTKNLFKKMQKDGNTNCSEFWNVDNKKDKLKIEFRHRHIAYCILRGRTIEEIERKTREDNKHNQRLVEQYINEYTLVGETNEG